MEIIFALILTYKSGYAGGMTTVGYYNSLEKCEIIGKKVEDEKTTFPRVVRYFCIPVDKISQ